MMTFFDDLTIAVDIAFTIGTINLYRTIKNLESSKDLWVETIKDSNRLLERGIDRHNDEIARIENKIYAIQHPRDKVLLSWIKNGRIYRVIENLSNGYYSISYEIFGEIDKKIHAFSGVEGIKKCEECKLYRYGCAKNYLKFTYGSNSGLTDIWIEKDTIETTLDNMKYGID